MPRLGAKWRFCLSFGGKVGSKFVCKIGIGEAEDWKL